VTCFPAARRPRAAAHDGACEVPGGSEGRADPRAGRR
jgi:hypothetical protein